MVPSSLKRGRLCFPVYYGLRRPPINFSPLWFDENKERNVYFLQLQQRNSCHSTSDFPTRSLAQMAFAVKQIALQTPMYFEAGRSTRLFDNRRICVLETSFRTSMSLLFAEMLMPVSISVGFLFLFETEAQLHTHGYHGGYGQRGVGSFLGLGFWVFLKSTCDQSLLPRVLLLGSGGSEVWWEGYSY